MHCLPFSRARPAEYMVHVLIDYLSTGKKIIYDVLVQCTVYDMPVERHTRLERQSQQFKLAHARIAWIQEPV